MKNYSLLFSFSSSAFHLRAVEGLKKTLMSALGTLLMLSMRSPFKEDIRLQNP